MNIDLPTQPSGLISREELLILAAHRGGPHVSVYLPTEKAGPATRENPIRFKNLLRDAEEGLVALGMRPTEARDLLKPSRELVDDRGFWEERQTDGLSLHVTPGFTSLHHLPLRPPHLAVVGERFHLRPLLELFTADAAFYLLAISQNDVRLLRCGRYSEQEVSVEGMPHGLEDALWADRPEREQQFRSQPVGQASGKQGAFGVFHGSGDIVDDEAKERLFRYFRKVDEVLKGPLHSESAPLVIASVAYLQPIYAEANTYKGLVPEGVAGNPDILAADELRARGWERVESQLARLRHEALARFAALQGTGLASADIEEVVREAGRGRVDTLLAAQDGPAWGAVTADGERVQAHAAHRPGDEDLVDRAGLEALTHGGRLFTLAPDEMPAGTAVAAIYRY